MFRSKRVRPHGRSGRTPATTIALAGLALLVVGPERAAAQALGGRVSVEALTGVYFPDDVAFESGEADMAIEEGRIYGGRLGLAFTRNLLLQGSVAFSPLRVIYGGTEVNLNTFMYDAVLGYSFPLMGRLEGLLLGGGGMTQWTLNGGSSVESLNAVAGGGFRFHVSPGLALRLDARDHIIFDSYTELREQLSPGLDLSRQTTHSVEITAGLALRLPFTGGGGGGGGGGYGPDDWVGADPPESNSAARQVELEARRDP